MDEKLIKKEPLGGDYYVYVTPHHTFGTDAVLLSHFAKARKNDLFVDLGTGCGIIPLLLLRDGLLQKAIGVDISEEAVFLAQKAADEFAPDKLEVLLSNLNCLKGKVKFGSHTLVTCNPPYKSPDGGIKNKDEIAKAARHETACTLEDIILVSSRLLRPSGRLCICQRPERLTDLMTLMRKYNTEPKRLRLVCKEKGKEPWLVMVEGKKCSRPGLRIDPTLYVEENGEYSPEMKEIYGAYREAYSL